MASEITVKLKGQSAQLRNELKKTDTKLKQTGNQFSSFKSKLGAVKGAGLAVGAALVTATIAMKKIMATTISYGVKIDKMMKLTNMSAESLTKLSYAAEQEHSSMEALEKGLTNLTVRLGYAGDGLVSYTRYFDALGISYRKADGTLRDTYDVFLDIADAASKGKLSTEKMAAIMQLFGARSAKELIPLLKKGTAWFEKMGGEAEKLGLVLSDLEAQKMKAFDDEMTELKKGMQGLTIQIGMKLMPVIEDIVAGWGQYGKILREINTEIKRNMGIMQKQEEESVMLAYLTNKLSGEINEYKYALNGLNQGGQFVALTQEGMIKKFKNANLIVEELDNNTYRLANEEYALARAKGFLKFEIDKLEGGLLRQKKRQEEVTKATKDQKEIVEELTEAGKKRREEQSKLIADMGMRNMLEETMTEQDKAFRMVQELGIKTTADYEFELRKVNEALKSGLLPQSSINELQLRAIDIMELKGDIDKEEAENQRNLIEGINQQGKGIEELNARMQLFSTTMGPLVDDFTNKYLGSLIKVREEEEGTAKAILADWSNMIAQMIAKAAILAAVKVAIGSVTGGAGIGFMEAFGSMFGAKKGGMLGASSVSAQHGVVTRRALVDVHGNQPGGEAFLPLTTFYQKMEGFFQKYSGSQQPVTVVLKTDGLLSLRDKNVQDVLYDTGVRPAEKRYKARAFE